MNKKIIILSFALLPLRLFAIDGEQTDTSKQDTKPTRTFPILVNVEPYIHHISDINFRDQEYKIEVWLKLKMNDSLWAVDSLANQFAVVGSKDLSITIIPQYPGLKDSVKADAIKSKKADSPEGKWKYRRLIKLECTVIKKWDIKKYPFDRQELDIKIYTLRSSKWLKLVPSGNRVNYASDSICLKRVEIENGWFFNCDSITTDTVICQDIFDHGTKYSTIHLNIPLTRKNGFALFFKLFIGMYISFFVAFLSFFIHVKHFEPRFGLPVGGLFAAIGNKYITENVLPQSSAYTIVDTFHTVTIIAILLVIVFSAISLNLSDSSVYSVIKSKIHPSRKLSLMKWIDQNGRNLLLISYVFLNIVFGFLNIL